MSTAEIRVMRDNREAVDRAAEVRSETIRFPNPPHECRRGGDQDRIVPLPPDRRGRWMITPLVRKYFQRVRRLFDRSQSF
jgi:hypothetical protein